MGPDFPETKQAIGAEIDAAVESIVEAERKHETKRDFLESVCGMPARLTSKQVDQWAGDQQKQSAAHKEALRNKQHAYFSEIESRLHQRMLAAGFSEYELSPFSHLPNFVKYDDRRKPAFDAAMLQYKRDNQAVMHVLGVESPTEIPQEINTSTAIEASNEIVNATISVSDTLSVISIEDGTKVIPDDTSCPKPIKLLAGWAEIANALEVENNEAFQKRIKKYHSLNSSPIIFGGPGFQPKVDKRMLIEWSNSLLDIISANNARIADRKETVANTQTFGRNGTVVPDIGGHEKPRRTSPAGKHRKTSE